MSADEFSGTWTVLRVRPMTSCGITEPSEHEAD
jgi:hypothetical protein